MKKIILLLIVSYMLLSCKATYNRAEETPLKGSWTVTSVNYSEKNIRVKAFNFADAQCFVNSVWSFIPNNHTGNVAIYQTKDCPAAESNITWFIDQNQNFNVKIVGSGEKAKNVYDGYILSLANQTENSFNLIQSASLEGKPVQITYVFSKN